MGKADGNGKQRDSTAPRSASPTQHLVSTNLPNPPVCHGSTAQQEQEGTWGEVKDIFQCSIQKKKKKSCINKKSCKRNRRASSTLNPEFNEAEVSMLK